MMTRLHNGLMMPIELPGEHIEITGGGYGGIPVQFPVQQFPGEVAPTATVPRIQPNVTKTVAQAPAREPVFEIDQQTLLIGGAILLAILIVR